MDVPCHGFGSTSRPPAETTQPDMLLASPPPQSLDLSLPCFEELYGPAIMERTFSSHPDALQDSLLQQGPARRNHAWLDEAMAMEYDSPLPHELLPARSASPLPHELLPARSASPVPDIQLLQAALHRTSHTQFSSEEQAAIEAPSGSAGEGPRARAAAMDDSAPMEGSKNTSPKGRKKRSFHDSSDPTSGELTPTRDEAHGRRVQASKYRGVSWHVGSKRWRAAACVDKQYHHLGYFRDQASAAVAYDIACVRMRPKTRVLRFLNFPDMLMAYEDAIKNGGALELHTIVQKLISKAGGRLDPPGAREPDQGSGAAKRASKSAGMAASERHADDPEHSGGSWADADPRRSNNVLRPTSAPALQSHVYADYEDDHAMETEKPNGYSMRLADAFAAAQPLRPRRSDLQTQPPTSGFSGESSLRTVVSDSLQFVHSHLDSIATGREEFNARPLHVSHPMQMDTDTMRRETRQSALPQPEACETGCDGWPQSLPSIRPLDHDRLVAQLRQLQAQTDALSDEQDLARLQQLVEPTPPPQPAHAPNPGLVDLEALWELLAEPQCTVTRC